MAGTGSPRNSSPANNSLEVLRMQVDTNSMARQSAMMIKFTDESIAALKVAQKTQQLVRLKIDKQGGAIEIGCGGQATIFRFVIQEVPGAPADAVSHDCQKRYRTVATFHSKIQVQTTAKSLAETRDKLIEEEKKKHMKDSSRHKREQRPVTVKRATNPLAIGAQRPSSSSSARSHHSDSSNKSASSRSMGNQQQQVSSNASAELSRRPLRKRVIHLVILGRFSSASEVITKMRKDSLNEEIAQEDADRVQEIIDEIGELNRETGRLQLKQSFYNEVDARWPGFSSDEKSYVRKILSGSMGNNISNFAPVRKSRIVPMIAPGAGTLFNNATLSTDDSSFRSLQSRSPESTASSISSKSPSEIINYVNNTGMDAKVNDDLNNSNMLSLKRKAHANSVVASPQITSKRPRQQSLSPPEDPSNANLALHPQQTKITGQRTVGLNDTERPVSSTNAGSSPNYAPQTGRDWLKEFPEPRSLEEAEKYYLEFLDDYPKYQTCYNLLSAVVNEFKELEKKMNETPKNSKEHEKAEEAIEMRYMHYQRNPEYLETRQRHEDLRSKLEILKKHVDFWEKNQRKQLLRTRLT